ncbi:MAG: hypothetical protein LUQ11_06215 [Methylococcaceae bacterium]|nr:hypothetical protein [Methylococcaceae bacterium]
MAIQKEFVLRYRHDGHVRFQIPSRLCEAAVAKLISDNVVAIGGVYSVRVYRGQQKLSIRYDEQSCDFKTLAKRLSQVLDDLEQQGWFDNKAVVESGRARLTHKLKQSRISRWFGEKYQAAQETAQAAKLLGKISTKGPKALINDPEKAIIDFLNDILVLYLIRVHWTRITQEWLVRPLVYRYEWMAVFYLFFLLVRSRRKK